MLERYRYTIAAAGLALLLLPRVPGIGQQVNGAYLGVGIGSISFQPAEFGKLAIVIFLAAYLRDNRQLLVQGARRFAGHHGAAAEALRAAARRVLVRRDVPALHHPGPGLVADVLRRLPGAALRRHQPVLVRGGRAGAVRRRRVRHVPDPQPHPGPRGDLARPVQARPGRARGLPDRPVPVRAGRRRAVRHRLRPGAAVGRRHAAAARRRHRPHLLRDRQRARAGRRVRAAARLPAVRRARDEDGDDRPRLVLQAARRRA